MRTLQAVAIASLALLLAGCSAGGPYSAGAAQQLQQATLELADASQAQDYTAALQRLAVLEQANDAALQRGEIGQARHDAIAGSIASVRGDLMQLQAQQQQSALQQQLDQLQQQLQQQSPQPSDGGKKHKNGEGG